ncbi:MFS transporter [Streptacidiphilus sp. N8-3]|uniref:MFS transporter n=1 Tax=Streptacidiphilus cavernicola TaxID=3342716 RepID=A0ABV6VNP8_9ACTN
MGGVADEAPRGTRPGGPDSPAPPRAGSEGRAPAEPGVVITGRRRGFGRRLHRAASATARGTGNAVHATGRRIRRATSAEGAGESGLAKLIELHAVSSAGDMMITVALASTIFFSVPTGEARGRVALYLLITMAPFVLLAPVIGPLLDRLPSGRRAAMALSMLARAAIAWMMTSSIAGGGLDIYPEALGVLVASKAYGVVRSVVVPRLLPARVTLVKANSRVTLAGLLATGVAAAIGGGLHLIGPSWPLRGAFLVFLAGAFLAFGLPHQVDLAEGEQRAVLHGDDPADPADAAPVSLTKRPAPLADRPGPAAAAATAAAAAAPRAEGPSATAASARPRMGLRTVGPAVVLALRAEGTLRGLSGFLTFFLAFLLREHPFPGLRPTVALACVAAALAVGNTLGTVLGSWLKARGPEILVTLMLSLATAAAVAAALFYGLLTVTLLAGVAGLSQSLGKVALDALIQRDVPEQVRTSGFARSETLMQLTWVLGGGLGIVLPLVGRVGMGTAAGILALSLAFTVRGLVRMPRVSTRPYLA